MTASYNIIDNNIDPCWENTITLLMNSDAHFSITTNHQAITI